MFDLGAWGEFIFIILAAIILIRPKDFPKIMYEFSKIVNRARAYKYQLQTQYYEVVHGQERKEFLEKEQNDASSKDAA